MHVNKYNSAITAISIAGDNKIDIGYGVHFTAKMDLFKIQRAASKVAKGVICGFGVEGYVMSLKAMSKFLKNEN